jgi:hypothetical protein
MNSSLAPSQRGFSYERANGAGAATSFQMRFVVRAGASGLEARGRQRQLLLDEVRRRGSLSTAEAVEFLQEDDPAMVRHLLNDLVRAGMIEARGRTRARRFYAL